MKINDAGLSLLKSFEGCKLTAYKDIVGIVTIGYGSTGANVHMGMTITQDVADKMLEDHLNTIGKSIDFVIKDAITDNQASAILCLVYNIGTGNFEHSTLLRKLNAGDSSGAAEEFLKWDHAGGGVVPGLTRRRQAERALFLLAD